MEAIQEEVKTAPIMYKRISIEEEEKEIQELEAARNAENKQVEEAEKDEEETQSLDAEEKLLRKDMEI